MVKVKKRSRGRPSKGNGVTRVAASRLSPALRSALERSAAENGRTLSAEIEARLLASFPATGKRSIPR